MKNENFNYYGDTIIRIADRKNWMKSFETNVLIPTNTGTFVFADDTMTDSDKASLLYSLGFGSYSDAMTYIEDKKRIRPLRQKHLHHSSRKRKGEHQKIP